MVVVSGTSYLTGKEFALRLGIAERTLSNWRVAGKLPGVVRVGRRLLFPESLLSELLKPA